jgi:uncharacterized membrane protein
VTVIGALLVVSALLCALVAGFVFAFAVVVMPGIKGLDDGAFIRAFQVIDRVIQQGQPLFMLVWLGSAVSAAAAAIVGVWALSGANRLLVIAAALIYICGAQLPTFGINLPLNNALQKLDPAAMSPEMRARERHAFEAPWNRANVLRTVCATVTTVLLLVVLLRV